MALETKASRSHTETEKNKSREMPVDLESGLGLVLKRWRKKIEMLNRLISRNRLNGAKGFDPKRNHRKDTRETGTLQPAIPSARYSLAVSCAPRMFFKVRAISAVPRATVSRIPKTIRP